MHVNFHDPKAAEPTLHQASTGGMFCTLDFRSEDGEVTLFLRAHQMNAARAIAAIFNGDIDALTARISLAIPGFVEMPDRDVDSMAFSIACDLTGKDINEALRERREAEDAA